MLVEAGLLTARKLSTAPATGLSGLAANFPLMITAWAAGRLDRRSGELSASRAHARPFPVVERDSGAAARTVAQDGIACLPTVMRAELAILRVDPNAGRANPEPH